MHALRRQVQTTSSQGNFIRQILYIPRRHELKWTDFAVKFRRQAQSFQRSIPHHDRHAGLNLHQAHARAVLVIIVRIGMRGNHKKNPSLKTGGLRCFLILPPVTV